MTKANKSFFKDLRKEINEGKKQNSIQVKIGCSKNFIISSPKSVNDTLSIENNEKSEEAYDELCRQNIELTNEIALLKKQNSELQNKLEFIQSTTKGEPEYAISLEAFIRHMNESFDEEEVKAIRNLGRALFDGEAKAQINKVANDQLAKMKMATTINNNFNKPVGTMVAYTDEITLKHE